MKRILFSIALTVILFTSAEAQIGKGMWFLGGAFGLSVEQSKTSSSGSTTNDDASFHLGFYPNLGYFVNDRVAIGTGIGYLGGATTRGTTSAGLFGVSPYVRKYYQIGKLGTFYFFGQFSVDLGFGHTKDITASPAGETITTKNNVTSFGFGLSPGFALFPTKRIGTEFTFGYIPFSVVDRQNYLFGYTSLTTKPDPNPSDQKKVFATFGLGIRSIISTSLTFKYYFGAKDKGKEKIPAQE